MTDTPTDTKLSERFDFAMEHSEIGMFSINNADAILSALRLAESHPSTIKRAFLGLTVLRTMLKKEGLALGVQTTDELMADMAWVMPELPGLSALRAESHPSAGAFKLGDPIQKKSGASWRGKVVGFYATDLTPRGYCVESANEPGSVQIYPEAALVEWKPEMSYPSAIREAVEGEREACAKIADRRADSSNKDCERLSFDGSTGTLECSLSHRGDCLCQEHQEEAEAIAVAIRARGEEKGNG